MSIAADDEDQDFRIGDMVRFQHSKPGHLYTVHSIHGDILRLREITEQPRPRMHSARRVRVEHVR